MDSQCQNSADSLAESTPNASKNFSPICLPKPKSFRFKRKKLSLGVHSPESVIMNIQTAICSYILLTGFQAAKKVNLKKKD